MQIRHLSLAAGIVLAWAGAVGAANADARDYSAKHVRHHAHRTHVVVYPRDPYGPENGWGSGPGGYPAHSVPLAAYPNPYGLGLIFEPFGWVAREYRSDRRDGGWR